MKSEISVEIIFALPDFQFLEKIMVKNGSTLENALKLSKLNLFFPNINFAEKNFFGIFGKKCEINHILSDGDRIEIYRPIVRNKKSYKYKKNKTC